MKKLLVFTGILAILFFLSMSDNAFSKSSENKAACERWCNANKPRCAFCDSDAFCEGRTYDVIKSFKEGTGNWYACGLSEYARESQKNKTDCEAWCRQDERCEFCKDKVGCGINYASIKMFGGRGENWYACANRDRLSQLRKQECDTWCEANRDDITDPCIKCSSASGCGRGYKVIKRFQGEGENWNACAYIVSREECENFCKNSAECEFCSDNPGCGAGYTSMKTFRGLAEYDYDYSIILSAIGRFGQRFMKNWYACKKK